MRSSSSERVSFGARETLASHWLREPPAHLLSYGLFLKTVMASPHPVCQNNTTQPTYRLQRDSLNRSIKNSLFVSPECLRLQIYFPLLFVSCCVGFEHGIMFPVVVFVCVPASVCGSVSGCVYRCTACACLFLCVCVRLCVCIHPYVCVHARLCVCLRCVCVCVCSVRAAKQRKTKAVCGCFLEDFTSPPPLRSWRVYRACLPGV